ncbi:alanine dehydrogenase [candidate division KSB1 bacterium]|nr:MAG: alanine dehydrogenase [candidate division KSB1 bacterium]
MNIGIINEFDKGERRVGLTPGKVHHLVEQGNTVYFEKGAGTGSHFSDEEFIKAGAIIQYSAEEVFGRSDMIIKVASITKKELQMIYKGQIILSFLHLVTRSREIIEGLLSKEVTAIGYEIIEEDSGELPILTTMSEISGQMAIQIAGYLLEAPNKGRGIMIGSVPGVHPANILIIGAGVVGTCAARTALGMGANVYIMDIDIKKLRTVENTFNKMVRTVMSNRYNLLNILPLIDVLIGAVLVPGDITPNIVTADMLKLMKKGSVIIDVSIDQGGCIETSRPTTISHPTYIKEGVIHYCVPNIPSLVPRTSTYALTNTSKKYIYSIAEKGVEECIKIDSSLLRGVYTYKGKCTNQRLSGIFGLEYLDLSNL